MQAPELLQELEARGAVVAVEGDRLRVTPHRVLDDNLRKELRRLKPELLAMLAAPDTTAVTTTPTFRNAPVTALEKLQDEAALCRVPWCHGLIRVNAQLLELWRRAEKETGQALTIAGKPRVIKPRTNDAVMHDEYSRARVMGFDDKRRRCFTRFSRDKQNEQVIL